MSNKYQSNCRTFTARNIVWNGATFTYASPPVLFSLAAPAPIIFTPVSRVDNPNQFFNMNQYDPTFDEGSRDFNKYGNILVRRAGIFGNFADGLVLENSYRRLSLYLRFISYTVSAKAGTITFVQDDNRVTGAGFLTAFSIGSWVPVADTTDINNAYFYFLRVLNDTQAILSDFAKRSSVLASIPTLVPDLTLGNYVQYYIRDLPALNYFYEVEKFFSVPINSDSEVALADATLFIEPLGGSLSFFTDTIDTTLNGKKVSFDAVLEIEITPNETSTPIPPLLYEVESIAVAESLTVALYPVSATTNDSVTIVENSVGGVA